MSDRETSRRRIVGSLLGVGSLTVLGSRSARAQPTEKGRPNRYGESGTRGSSFRDPAYLNHLLDMGSARERVRTYERTGRTEALITPALQRAAASTDDGTVDVTVQTTGRRARVRTSGQFGRRLFGWQPTPAEVRRLGEYGDVGATMSVASTAVAVSNVAVEDLSELVDLPFVLEVGHDPEIAGVNGATRETSATVTTSSTPTADDLRTSAHSDFESVSQLLDVKVGGFVAGYEPDGVATAYGKNWAQEVGIDTDLAKDFSGAGGWRVSDDLTHADHGSDVLNTAAYMLKPFAQRNDHMVPIRIWDTSADGTDDPQASDFSNAVDYALKNDIAAGVCSLVVTGNVSYCPSSVCAELESYATAGYTMAVASGTQNNDTNVDYPAGSYFTVGVGAYNGASNDGFGRDEKSQYCTVSYYSDAASRAYCPWCHDYGGDAKFCPDIYSCGDFSAPDGGGLGGTSMAAPVVGAAGGLDVSSNPADSHYNRLSRYHDMNTHPVYPSDTSKLGGALYTPTLV
ncbi:S8 family serine peptidase [Halobaculum sp. MBLA0147]|uniref:S8 family serine peptidase n=1 Tax=Halobaculum sp. MBLA0147 TaxID=3079934 RepID=UPI003524EF5D